MFATSPLAVSVPAAPLQRGREGKVIVGLEGVVPAVSVTILEEGDLPQTLMAVA